MGKKKGIAIALAAVVVAGGAFAAMRLMNSKDKSVAVQEPVSEEVRVTVQTPSLGNIAQSGEFMGSVEPDESVQVFPKVGGEVLATYFEIGDQVKKGQLLYEVDATDLELQYEAQLASVDAARISADQSLGSAYDSNLVGLKAQVDSAQASLNSARTALKNYDDNTGESLLNLQAKDDKLRAQIANLKDVLDEVKGMDEAAFEEKYGTRQTKDDFLKEKNIELTKAETEHSMIYANIKDLDDDDDPNLRSLRTAYRNAQIGYNAAKEAYDRAAGINREDAVISTEAGIHAQEVALKSLEKKIADTKVYAPIDGVIEQKNISVHDMAGSSTAAYTISNKSVMTVKFSVSEDAVAGFSQGDVIGIEKGGETFDGAITEIATMADQATGLYVVKASVPDNGKMRTGSVVKIYADTKKSENAQLLPVDCIYYDAGDAYVYTEQNGVAVKTPVETGISNGGVIEIVSGLTPDSRVVNAWHPKLRDGAQLTVVDKMAPPDGETASSASKAGDADGVAGQA